MRVLTTNGKDYRLPDIQNPFQQAMYMHLIDWKWKHNIKDAGYHTYRGKKIPYDAILPESVRAKLPIIYSGIRDDLRRHQENEESRFKLHQHFNHMASSQAANINLFLPVLLSPSASRVLRQVKSDFGELATDGFDRGFQLEYWGPRDGKGLLGDHTNIYGTDSDIAIAYRDNTANRDLCLWLIEHKLTENDFTVCHGLTSKGRQDTHDCDKSFAELLNNMHLCYYHDARRFKYWEITAKNLSFFRNHKGYSACPFKGGTNQLWRNQLLGLAVEKDKNLPYERVYFSVVKHPENCYLDKTINQYRAIIGDTDRFSVFTSLDVVNAAAGIGDAGLSRWVDWYRDLYKL